MRTFEFCCVLTFVGLPLTADPGSAPVLQWVKQISGSGQSFATASAVDSQGNLYITGSTAALDFPTVSAARAQAGGSTLMRVDAASGAAQKLSAPLLASAANFAFDPQNPSNIYATSSSSTGVTDAGSNWTNYLIRSIDSGATWTTVSAFPSTPSGIAGSKVTIDCLAIDPVNSNVLYACPDAEGILKSIDGGFTWTAINQGLPGFLNSQPRPVYRVWVDPHFPSVLFAASQSALVRSSDAGATWSVVLAGEPFYQGALAFDPFTPGTIYWGGSYSSQFIGKSTDDGLTWTGQSAPPLTPFSACDDCLVYIDPVHPGVWYFASANYMGGLYRSDDVSGAVFAINPAYSVMRSQPGLALSVLQ
jgi:hypothetical protein